MSYFLKLTIPFRAFLLHLHRGSLFLVLCAVQAFAVDPPPFELLNAPPEEQLRYLERVGADSERLRAQVGQQRFEKRQQEQQALSLHLRDELAEQRALMALSQPVSKAYDSIDGVQALPWVSFFSFRSLVFVGFLILLLAVYTQRSTIFATLYLSEKERAHRLAAKWGEKWE